MTRLTISDLNKVLSGRAEGAKERNKLKLNNRDIDNNRYIIDIPDDKMGLTISWFLACFGESVRFLGEYKFREKYSFMGKIALLNEIENGIERSQKLDLPF